jgi:hypothetical protein
VASFEQSIVREPGVETVEQYGRRVHRLALAYVTLFVGSCAGAALLIWQGQFFVTLTQRSNVETLTLAFFLVLFAYVGTLSAFGAAGAGRIAYFAVVRRAGHDRREVERQKMRALEGKRGETLSGALSAIVERAEAPGQPFSLAIADEAGTLGTVTFDGAELRHDETIGNGSNGLLAFVVHQINDLLQQRGDPGTLDVVEWSAIDSESTLQYLGLVRFAQNLERRLDADELWPKIRLTDDDCAALERRLSRLCPARHDEAFLPDWEYAAEHKVPIIPEPLGLVSLSRTERRADPIATLGCAVLVVLAAVVTLAVLNAFPPWVPGS